MTKADSSTPVSKPMPSLSDLLSSIIDSRFRVMGIAKINRDPDLMDAAEEGDDTEVVERIQAMLPALREKEAAAQAKLDGWTNAESVLLRYSYRAILHARKREADDIQSLVNLLRANLDDPRMSDFQFQTTSSIMRYLYSLNE